MKLYVYDAETKEIEAVIEGVDNAACEAKAGEIYGDTDRWGWAYSDTGLIRTTDTEEIAA